MSKKTRNLDTNRETESASELIDGPRSYESAEEYGGRVARELIRESIESRSEQ